MKRIGLAAMILLLVLAVGCTTKFSNTRTKLEQNSRVAVLLVGDDGTDYDFGMAENYVFNAMLKHNLEPVSLNSADVKSFGELHRDYLGEEKLKQEAKEPLAFSPVFLENMQEYLSARKIDYLLLLNFDISGLDEHLQAMLVHVNDMKITASKYYDFSIMSPMCTGTFFVSWLYCPFLMARNSEEASYLMINEMLEEFMGMRVSSSQRSKRRSGKSLRSRARQRKATPEPVTGEEPMEDEEEFDDDYEYGY